MSVCKRVRHTFCTAFLDAHDALDALAQCAILISYDEINAYSFLLHTLDYTILHLIIINNSNVEI